MSLRPERAVLLLIAGATVVRVVLAAITDLGLDEAYALAVSHPVQLSWFDHPPLTFWIVAGVEALFGRDVPAVLLRLPFIALSAASTWLLYRLAARHFGDGAGLWAAVLFTASPFFLLSAGSWVVPDGPLCFFLLLAAVALTPIVLDRRVQPHWRDWLLAGAALGIALLSKYHAALFALGALGYFLAVPRLRVWFARPQPYVAVLIALLLFTPVLVWNAQNDWVSFGFQLGRGAAAASTPLITARIFLTEAAYLLPTTALLLLAAFVWALARRVPSAGFFLALGLPTVLVLDATRFWTWQSYAHWSMPGWMFLLPLVGAMLVRWQQRWRPALPIVAGVTGLQFAVVVVGVVVLLSSIRIHEPGVDSYRIEAGSWRGVADGIRERDALAGTAAIVATRWRDGARIAEALRTDLPVLVFDSDPRGFAWADQQSAVGRAVLVVTEDAELPAPLAAHFESVTAIGVYPLEADNATHTLHVFRATLLEPYPLPYGR